MRFITTAFSSLRNRHPVLPTLGILTIFCGFAAFGPDAAALAAGDTGPMTGDWIFTFKNTAYPNDGSKTIKSTEELLVSITDSSPGSTSQLTIQIVGQEEGGLFGQRSGNGFVMLNLFSSETTLMTLGGSMTPPKNGLTKTLKGTGNEMFVADSAVPPTSDGGQQQADVTLFKFTAKRAPN